jgi:hypothetical protein
MVRGSLSHRREIFELALDEEVLLLLDKYHRYKEEYEVPFAVSQRGIAMATGVVINNLPRTLNKMISRGLIEKEIKRVKGIQRKQNGYFLTEPGGKEEVKKLSDFINDIPVMLQDNGNDFIEMRLSELRKHLEEKFHLYDFYNFLNDNCLYDSHLIRSKEEQSIGSADEPVNIFSCIISPQFRRRSYGVDNGRTDYTKDLNRFTLDFKEIDRDKYGVEQIEKGQNGQIVFNAKDIESQFNGDHHKVEVHLTIAANDYIDMLTNYGLKAMRRYKIHRLTNEAYYQGGVLSPIDLAGLMCSSIGTIRSDIFNMHYKDIFIPLAGIYDWGGKDLFPIREIHKYL